MNQGRIWCVVHPTVGLPLFLTSVAATSFIVHACVMTNTTWMANYWQGKAPRTAENNTGSALASTALTSQAPYVVSIAPVAGTPGKSDASFVVTVTANPAAAPIVSAAAETPDAAPTLVAATDTK